MWCVALSGGLALLCEAVHCVSVLCSSQSALSQISQQLAQHATPLLDWCVSACVRYSLSADPASLCASLCPVLRASVTATDSAGAYARTQLAVVCVTAAAAAYQTAPVVSLLLDVGLSSARVCVPAATPLLLTLPPDRLLLPLGSALAAAAFASYGLGFNSLLRLSDCILLCVSVRESGGLSVRCCLGR